MKSLIAQNVKQIIKDRCLIQAAVARKAGYTPKAFNNMLNGRKIISDCDVKAIADTLQVKVNQLFETRGGENANDTSLHN